MHTAEIVSMKALPSDFSTPFAVPLLRPDVPSPASVTGPGEKRAEKRYGVYRNNVTVGLIDALASIFPAVERITGPDFFRAMARFHVRETPPTSPLLFEYGRQFADYIDGYEYAVDMPWLSDVARIERAWLDSYHAADAPFLTAEELAAAPPERLGEAVFEVNPATRLLSSPYPAVSIFAMNRGNGPAGRVESRAEDCLITRLNDEVTVRILPPGGYAFLGKLAAGCSLEVAVKAAFDADQEFDLSNAIGEMIAAGAFSHITTESSDVGHN